MKLINRFKLIWRMCARRVFTTILLFSMCAMAFYMIDEVLQNYYRSHYRLDKIINEFGRDVADVNYVRVIDKVNVGDSTDMIKDYVSGLDGVEACGYFKNSPTSNIEGFESVSIVCAEKQLINLGNLKLSSENREALEKDWGTYEPVLLGSKYKGKVEVGTVFKFSYFYEEKECVIAGFLEKGAAWPQQPQTLLGGSAGTDVYTLDNSGILLTERYEIYKYDDEREFYYIADSSRTSEIAREITDFSIDNGIGVGVYNLQETIDKEKEENGISDDKTFFAAVLLVILAMVSVTAASVIYTLMSKAEYGVMMVCGAKRSDVMSLMIIYNAIIYIVSAVSAWVIRQYALFGMLIPVKSETNSEVLYLAEFVPHNIYIPLIFAGIIVVLIIVSNIMPLYFIGRETLSELLHSRKD